MKKTQSKKNKRSYRQWLSNNKQVFWLAIFFIAVAGFFVVMTMNRQAINNDRLRFESVDNKKAVIINKLVNYLSDNVVATRDQNQCFNAEQGPYDNGRLWCQVASVITLDKNIEYSEVADQYVEFGREQGLDKGSNKPFSGVWVVDRRVNIKCQLVYQDNDSNISGLARRIPFSDDEHIAIAVTCAARAKAKHYPYVED